jgi:hypothetical protein
MLFLAHRLDWEWLIPAFVNLLKGLGILPGAVAAFWLRNLYQKHRQRKATEGWRITEARIHSVEAHREGRKLWVEISYSYFVSEYRAGTYIRRIRSRDEADELIRNLRDKRLAIHYDPSNPDKSIIFDHELEMAVSLAPQLG